MKYNLVHKLLFVDTNVKNMYYFPYAPILDTIVTGDAKYGVRFIVNRDVGKPERLTQKFDYFWGGKNEKRIYYEHPILPGLKAKMLLDMSSDISTITVNDVYYRFVRYRFENVWPPGQHLANLMTVTLLQKNTLTLHSGAFSNKKTHEGYLVFGASNTGKSRTTFAALEKGYAYHSEDLTIADKNSLYTTPLISAQSSMLPNKNISLKYNLFVNSLTGINMILPRMRTLSSFRDFFESHDVSLASKVSKIFILEKGIDSISALAGREALRKMLILNRLELCYSRDHMLLAYSYFNRDVDLEQLMKVERGLMEEIVGKAECFLITSSSPNRYIDLIRTVMP